MAPGRGMDGSSHNNGTTDRLLGELIAEVRALKHNQNNSNQKLDVIGHLAEEVREMKEEQKAHNLRLAILEADKNRRDGAVGLVSWLTRNWPVSVLMAGLAAFIAWANGRIHP